MVEAQIVSEKKLLWIVFFLRNTLNVNGIRINGKNTYEVNYEFKGFAKNVVLSI